MMNNPITEGAVFKHTWIKWKKLPKLCKYDYLVAYCDPSFKGTSKNDYKAIKLWGKIGTELHQIEAFVRQCSVAEMVRWWYDLHERMIVAGVICYYYIEANFLQDIILDEFTREGNLRGYQLPIRADKRKKPDKFQRIEESPRCGSAGSCSTTPTGRTTPTRSRDWNRPSRLKKEPAATTTRPTPTRGRSTSCNSKQE